MATRSPQEGVPQDLQGSLCVPQGPPWSPPPSQWSPGPLAPTLVTWGLLRCVSPTQSPPCHLVLSMHPCPSCMVPPWSPVTPPAFKSPRHHYGPPPSPRSPPRSPGLPPECPTTLHVPTVVPSKSPGSLHVPWSPPCPLVLSTSPCPRYSPLVPSVSSYPLCVLLHVPTMSPTTVPWSPPYSPIPPAVSTSPPHPLHVGVPSPSGPAWPSS